MDHMQEDTQYESIEKKDNDILTRFCKKFIIYSLIYFFGYFALSLGWIVCFIILSVVNKEFKINHRKKLDFARASALGCEEQILSNNVKNLPSWVLFPDTERAEWLNKIIKQIWPHVNHYMRDLFQKHVEPKAQSYLGKNFKFENVRLGKVPFRIDGIKVYDKSVSRQKIIIDLDISYAGDCYITFNLSGMKGGIENFQLHGKMRIILKPLISSLPLIGGFQSFFMKDPEIDFDLVGMAQVLSIPGLRNILQKAVEETIASKIVFPNTFPIKLSEKISSSDVIIPEPEGVLRVHVIEAKHLMRKDIGLMGNGKSDPYAIVNIGCQQFKTSVIKNTVDPKWDYWCEFVLESNAKLHIHLWDQDDASKDESLGRKYYSTYINIQNVLKTTQRDLWLSLQDVMHGMVHIRLKWLTLSTSHTDLEIALEEVRRLNIKRLKSALLIVYIDGAKNLQKSKTLPDPYILLQIGKERQETEVVKQCIDPIYEEAFTFLVFNPEVESLYLKVCDKKNENNEIGEIFFNLGQLIQKPNMEVNNMEFNLMKTRPESTVVCSLKLRILRPENLECLDDSVDDRKNEETQIEETFFNFQQTHNPIVNSETSSFTRIRLTLKYSVQRHKLMVTVHEIDDILKNQRIAHPNTYVKMYLLPAKHKETKRKTRSVKNAHNPLFDETFEYTLTENELKNIQLEITASNKRRILKTRRKIIGKAIIDISQLTLDEPFTRWFDLQRV